MLNWNLTTEEPASQCLILNPFDVLVSGNLRLRL